MQLDRDEDAAICRIRLEHLSASVSEVLWAIRYLSVIPANVIEHCKDVLLDEEQNYYVRMAAGMLLCRSLLSAKFLAQCRDTFRREKNANVQVVLAGVLMQAGGDHARSILHMIVFHPSEKVRKLGKLLREVRYDTNQARQRLKFLFAAGGEWRLCDNSALLFSMSLSDRPEILRMLIARSSAAAKDCSRRDLRGLLSEVARRANRQLQRIHPAPPSVQVAAAE